MDTFNLDLDDLETFTSHIRNAKESSSSKPVLQSMAFDECPDSAFGIPGESSKPLDIAFPTLDSSVHTLRPMGASGSAKGKARMTEEFFDIERGDKSIADTSLYFYPSPSLAGSHKAPSSISSQPSSIAGTSFGTPSSFPITRNQGYQDDKPPFDSDSNNLFNPYLSRPEPLREDAPKINPYAASDFHPEITLEKTLYPVSSPGAGPSTPFSGISSPDRSFWDQFEPETPNDNVFESKMDVYSFTDPALSLPQEAIEDPWKADLEAAKSAIADLESTRGPGISCITPKPSRVSTPSPQLISTTSSSTRLEHATKEVEAAEVDRPNLSTSEDTNTNASVGASDFSAEPLVGATSFANVSTAIPPPFSSSPEGVTQLPPVVVVPTPAVQSVQRSITDRPRSNPIQDRSQSIRPRYSFSSLSMMSSGSGSSLSFKSFRLRPGLSIKKIKELKLRRTDKSSEREDHNNENEAGPSSGTHVSKPRLHKGQDLVKKVLRKGRKNFGPHRLKESDRSHSSPLPLSSFSPLSRSLASSACTSAAASSIAFGSLEDGDLEMEVVPEPVPVSVFEESLPVEVKLEVMRCLLFLHEVDQRRSKNGLDGWTLKKAGQEMWVGKMKGFRELVKFAVVSKSWQTLVTSSTLWDALTLGDAPFRSALMSNPPSLAPAPNGKFTTEGERVMDVLMRYAGPYLRSLDFSGFYRYDDHPRTILPMYGSSYGFFGSDTRLTMLKLRGCFVFSPKPLSEIIKHSPHLRRLDLKGIRDADCLATFDISKFCPRLASLDISRCYSLRGNELDFITGLSSLRVLRVAGLTHIGYLCRDIGKKLRELEVLDLSECDLDDDAVAALVDITEDKEQIRDDTVQKVFLKPKEAGYEPSASTITTFVRRVTKLRHLSLSDNDRLTDAACSFLAHSVPKLEFLELAGIGDDLGEDGIIALLNTTPMIRKIDLEDAAEIGDGVLEALTVKSPNPPLLLVDYTSSSGLAAPVVPQVGQMLEHLILSYASQLTNDALQSLIKASSHLSILELDNTRTSQTTIKEFIKACRRRHLPHAEIVTIDCRSVGESLVRDLAVAGMTRSRRGIRGFEERGLGYVDWRDVEIERHSIPSSPISFTNPLSKSLGMQHDECDPHRVVFKSFWSWSMVDAVKAIRERERKEREKEEEKEKKRLAKLNSGGSLTPKWLTLARRGSSIGSSGSGSATNESNGANVINDSSMATTTTIVRQSRGPIQIELNGDPNLTDWDDRNCVVM